ncbi:MAG TPA: hemolysin family protein [Longimicrobiales bacterium]|nr:hemolysin family protein [Longimicrobiales bacterium]
MTPVIVVLVAAAILASAFFTAAELAIFAAAESRIRSLTDDGVRGSGALSSLRTKPARVLVLLRLADAFADVAAGGLVVYYAYARWDAVWLALALGLVALLIVYLGELIPIGLAANHGLRFALLIAPVLVVITRILGAPLDLVARLSRVASTRSSVNAVGGMEPDIRHLTALGHRPTLGDPERELIERASRLDDAKVWDIMTPRVDIFAWRDDQVLRDLVPQLGAVRYSRVPVYRDTIDNITGVLYLRDAYQALVSGQRDVTLLALVREPLMVPGSVPVMKLMRDFQARRIHLAIVVDEYGGTDGLVTLEDVLEELVGEIEDETDLTEDAITRVTRNEIIAAGDADLREINHYFNTAFPQLEHRTFNGYLLEELDRVPAKGERFTLEGVMVEILDATDTQVVRVRLKRLGSGVDGAAPSGEAVQPARASVRDGDAGSAPTTGNAAP